MRRIAASAVAVADDADQLGRGPPPPGPARDAAQRDAGARRNHEEPDRPRSGPLGQRRDGEEQGDQRRRDGRGGADRRDLVDREMAERAVIAVVEAVELGDDERDRKEGERPEAVGGGDDGDEESDRRRQQVRAREQTPAQGVAPEARRPQRRAT